jgi:multiple sugar transport system ATP-binding protein
LGSVGVRLQTADETFVLPVHDAEKALRPCIGTELILGIRPELITDNASSQRFGRNVHTHTCKVELVEPTGPDTLVFIRINGEVVCCRVRPEQACRANDSMELAFNLSKAVFFDPKTEKRIV